MKRLIWLVCFLLMVSPTTHAFWFSLPDYGQNLQVFHAPYKGDFEGKTIKVLVWNIYKGEKDSFKNDYTYFEKNYDILMIQEAVDDGKFGEFMLNPFEHNYAFGVSFVYRFSGRETGVTTASRKPAVNHLKLLSPYRELVGFTPKAALFSWYKYSPFKKPLLTVNVHALNSVTKRMFAKHMDQLAHVIKGHNGPVLFGGDFNTWSKRKTRYLKKLTKKIGLKEVKFKNGHKRMKVFGNYLDYIFVKKLKVKEATVHHKVAGSDHKPMTVTVELP